jgi:hypothetical protein
MMGVDVSLIGKDLARLEELAQEGALFPFDWPSAALC